MFNNLIESTSHAREYKRRGSFVLVTTGVYALLLVLGGVASIYAYDAHLEDQTLEVVRLISPQDLIPATEPEPIRRNEPPRDTRTNDTGVTERATAMLSVNHPESVPETISTTPNKNLPLPDHGTPFITGRDRDAGSIAGPGLPAGGARVVQPAQVVTMMDPPPPAPAPAPVRTIKISRVLNSEAKLLPKPIYPILAKQIRLQGTVAVQVLIDETGKVVSAKALSGHPLLVREATQAALGARFSPTIIGDQPVKISGVITYNFIMP